MKSKGTSLKKLVILMDIALLTMLLLSAVYFFIRSAPQGRIWKKEWPNPSKAV